MTQENWNGLKGHVESALREKPTIVMNVAAIRKLLDCPPATIDQILKFHDDDDSWCGIKVLRWSNPLDDPLVELEFARR